MNSSAVTNSEPTPNQTLAQVSHSIWLSRSPLLLCHIAPDTDAVGSLTGLGLALRLTGRHTPTLACSDPVPAHLQFIPGASLIVQEAKEPYDLVITLDCADRERIGRLAQLTSFRNAPLVNIDHHITNTCFGQVNWVDPHASSTSEMVYRLLVFMGLPINAEIATSLLAGIVGDTRGFRTSNVTIEVMETAVQLMRAGASLPEVAQQALDRRSGSAIRLWGAALSALQIEDRLAWIAIPLEMRKRTGYTGNGDAGLASFIISADDVDGAAVFVEREDGRVEVGLRAAPGFDVARVALQFGGGGHALAAGCLVPGPLAEAQQRVLETLRMELARQRQRSS